MPKNIGFMRKIWELMFSDKINRSMLKKGFSLTEILIALAIIAIIAVLVLPVVTTRAQNRSFALAYESEVKQMLTSLEGLPVNEGKDSITQTMMFVDKDPSGAGGDGNYAENSGAYINKYMKIKKYCGNTPGDCFGNEYYEYKNKDRVVYNISDIKGACAQLKNGISLCLKPQIKSDDGKEEVEGWLDLNGPKGPNVYGRDLRHFTINLKQRVIFTDETGKIILPDPPELCEGDECPDIDPCKENPTSKECCAKRGTPEDENDVCCKAGWYNDKNHPYYLICHPKKNQCENHKITGPDDECCKWSEEAQQWNDTKCCASDDVHSYCCNLNPTSENCCYKKYVTDKEPITQGNKCCDYQNVYQNASGCQGICEREPDSLDCCKTSARKKEIKEPEDNCCTYDDINKDITYCCRRPQDDLGKCCNWKYNNQAYYHSIDDGEACCHNASFGIKSGNSSILTKCCRADKLGNNDYEENRYCCEHLVGNDYSKLKSGSALRVCCQYNKYKNRPECCSDTVDGMLEYSWEYNTACCMADSAAPNVRCCFDSSVEWKDNRLTGCCGHGDKVIDSYTGAKANSHSKWQKNCCYLGWKQYPDKDKFNSNCCTSETKWSPDCCDTLDPNNSLYKKKCVVIPACPANTVTSYNSSNGTYTGTKPTPECCNEFKNRNWKAADGTAINENYQLVCCKEYNICKDCAIRAKTGVSGRYDLPNCCSDSTMRSLRMKEDNKIWAKGCCSGGVSGDPLAYMTESEYKEVCCNPATNNTTGASYAGSPNFGLCCSKYVPGNACCSDSKLGYKWDNETVEAACCNYNASDLAGSACCNDKKPGIGIDGNEHLGCCNYSSDKIIGTACCGASGKQKNANGTATDNDNCCRADDEAPSESCCKKFQSKDWKGWDGKKISKEYKNYCCTNHKVCDCDEKQDDTNWKNACCGDGSDTNVWKNTAQWQTYCCSKTKNGIKYDDETEIKKCCKITKDSEVTDLCCNYAQEEGWPDSGYKDQCIAPIGTCEDVYKSDRSLDTVLEIDGEEKNCCSDYKLGTVVYFNDDPNRSVIGFNVNERVSKDCCKFYSDKKNWKKITPNIDYFEYEQGCCRFDDPNPTEECCKYYETWDFMDHDPRSIHGSNEAPKEYIDKCLTCSEKMAKANRFLGLGDTYDALCFWGRLISNARGEGVNDSREEACCTNEDFVNAPENASLWYSGCCSFKYLETAPNDDEYLGCCVTLDTYGNKNSEEYKAAFTAGSKCCTLWDANDPGSAPDSCYDYCRPDSPISIMKKDTVYYHKDASMCCDNRSDFVEGYNWSDYCCLLTNEDGSAFEYPASATDLACCDKRTVNDYVAYVPKYMSTSCETAVENACAPVSSHDNSKGWYCLGPEKCVNWVRTFYRDSDDPGDYYKFGSQEEEAAWNAMSKEEQAACCDPYNSAYNGVVKNSACCAKYYKGNDGGAVSADMAKNVCCALNVSSSLVDQTLFLATNESNYLYRKCCADPKDVKEGYPDIYSNMDLCCNAHFASQYYITQCNVLDSCCSSAYKKHYSAGDGISSKSEPYLASLSFGDRTLAIRGKCCVSCSNGSYNFNNKHSACNSDRFCGANCPPPPIPTTSSSPRPITSSSPIITTSSPIYSTTSSGSGYDDSCDLSCPYGWVPDVWCTSCIMEEFAPEFNDDDDECSESDKNACEQNMRINVKYSWNEETCSCDEKVEINLDKLKIPNICSGDPFNCALPEPQIEDMCTEIRKIPKVAVFCTYYPWCEDDVLTYKNEFGGNCAKYVKWLRDNGDSGATDNYCFDTVDQCMDHTFANYTGTDNTTNDEYGAYKDGMYTVEDWRDAIPCCGP